VIELGPPNATIHKIDEHVAVSRHRAAEEHLSPRAGEPARRVAGMTPEADNRLIALIDQAAEQLTRAQVAFGHGTHNAFDEAAWLVLWRLEPATGRRTGRPGIHCRPAGATPVSAPAWQPCCACASIAASQRLT
jgi:hypothetical protein